MCRTIVITKTEQAEAMLQHLDRVAEAVRIDDYASERAKPIRTLRCTCCGELFRGRQWWNQDCGYGLGDCCATRCGVKATEGESRTYGVPGIHFWIDLGAPTKEDNQ